MNTLIKKLPIVFLLFTSTYSHSSFALSEYDPLLASLRVNQLEKSTQQGEPLSWDASAWIGKNWHKVYLTSEGESSNGSTESENQLLYSTPVERFWDFQAGLGYDETPENSQTWGIVGFQGLAPYFFEINSRLLVNDKNAGVRLDAEYEALFTQRLILTPSLKLNAYTSDDKKMGIGSGLSSTELGMRLRYEFSRKFAPYIGLKWNQAYATTADYKKEEGGKTSETSLVAGLRFWF